MRKKILNFMDAVSQALFNYGGMAAPTRRPDKVLAEKISRTMDEKFDLYHRLSND